MIVSPRLREVRTPVTAEQLKPPGPQCETVQFFQVLTGPDHQKLAKFVRKYPHLELRVYGYDNRNLDFLRHYPDVRRLAIEPAKVFVERFLDARAEFVAVVQTYVSFHAASASPRRTTSSPCAKAGPAMVASSFAAS